jgi:hypothetical protein
MKHYIAMAGLHGCLPQYIAVHETYDSAVEGLTQLHELSGEESAELYEDGSLELDLHIHGNEYCEIEECGCNDPDCHADD